MAESRHDADIINQDRKEQAALLRGRVERMGVQVSVQTFTGDSSFPVEYRLTYGPVQAVGPTLDMAVTEFIERLLKHVPMERYT